MPKEEKQIKNWGEEEWDMSSEAQRKRLVAAIAEMMKKGCSNFIGPAMVEDYDLWKQTQRLK
jgi:hypothetical protein